MKAVDVHLLMEKAFDAGLLLLVSVRIIASKTLLILNTTSPFHIKCILKEAFVDGRKASISECELTGGVCACVTVGLSFPELGLEISFDSV